MRFEPKEPPRRFTVGFDGAVSLADCGRLRLEADEQVTLTTEGGGEYDVVRKAWGFYATPSLNGRLARFGLRGALASNRIGQIFLLLVESGKEAAFEDYVAGEGMRIVHWLDTDERVERLLETLGREDRA